MSDCIKFKDSDRVRIIHQRDRIGTVVGMPRRQAGESWYKVEFPDGRVQNVPERSLEIYEGAQDVESLLRRGVLWFAPAASSSPHCHPFALVDRSPARTATSTR